MCDLSRAEQGSLTSLLSDLQAARGSLSATYPEIFSRAWADLEAMLAALDDMADAADRVRAWITAKHQPGPQPDCSAGLDFHGAPGFRPQAAAAIIVSTNSTNVMACTLVQYRQMLPIMNSSA